MVEIRERAAETRGEHTALRCPGRHHKAGEHAYKEKSEMLDGGRCWLFGSIT